MLFDSVLVILTDDSANSSFIFFAPRLCDTLKCRMPCGNTSFNSSSSHIMFLNLVNAFLISENEGSKSVVNRYFLIGGFFLSLLRSFCKTFSFSF